MSDHSPGPWRIEECECSDSGTRWSEWAVTSPAGPICAEIFLEPNARLIAAAPDLLTAVQDARSFCLGRTEADGLAMSLDRVLASLEGRGSQAIALQIEEMCDADD